MYFRNTYEQEFDDLYMYLKAKYPQKLFDLEGIGIQTDMGLFSKKFFSDVSTVADGSVDANSNVDDLTVVAYENELPKPHTRLNSIYLLWKYGRRLFGKEYANRMVELELTGAYYINDLSNVQKSYCYNFSLYDLMTKGLPFVNKIPSYPAKHLSSFCGQLIHFTSYASNQVMGAVGLADLLIVMSYYVKKELDENPTVPEYVWKQVKQEIQSIIYSCNQPFRGGLQSGFYNVSVYDDYFLDSLVPDYIFPDGSSPNKDIVKKLQDIYLDVMNETMEISPITFPVTTACFCVDKEKNILDKNFLEYISKKNIKWAFINIYMGESSTLSSCCFDSSQKVLTKSSSGIFYGPISEVINGKWEEYKRNFTVFHNGSWVKAKPIKIKATRKMFSIKTANGKTIKVTDNHIVPTFNGDKCASELTTDDYLLFNTRALNSYHEKDEGLTYEQGYLIGLYAGDGSKYKRKDCESYSICFSLNSSDIDAVEIIKRALEQWDIDKSIHINYDNKLMSVLIYSKKLYNIINKYIIGNYAKEKEYNLDILLQSYEFRKGIIDGWYKSNGGNSNRIYSISEKLIETGEIIFTSIGVNTIIDKIDRTDEVEIKGVKYNRNYPSFTIRWYNPKNKRSMGCVYKVKNNSEYFKIVSIEEYDYYDEYVYCFEVENKEEPYFTLPNGHITHNCRLRSDKNNYYLGYSNSFGSGGTQIGSFGVVTLNLPQIAYLSNGNMDKFYEILLERADFASKINHTKRYILQKRIEKGALPLFTHGFMNLQKCYSTTGLNGIYECMDILGKNLLTEEGQKEFKKMTDILNKFNDSQDAKFKYAHNLEQTPSENSSIKLASKDRVLGLQDKYELYSNQFIPLVAQADLLDRIKLQGMFDGQFSGGSILHLNADSPITNYKQMLDLIESTAKTGTVYFAINYNLQKCEDGHMSVGRNDVCSVCGKHITDNYIRVVGFIVNVKNFHETRREHDYAKRQFYNGKQF